jgi:quinoprotein relay system zinc metallohydrolase 2
MPRTRWPLLGWACAVLACLPMHRAWADTVEWPVELQAVAPGLYVYWGAQETGSPRNLGAIANSAVVVGERCAAVIDPGGSLAFAQRLRQAMTQVTHKPVCAVINSHVHPDHLLGNPAFVEPGAEFYGHAGLPASLAVRGPGYLAAAQREIGLERVGTTLHAPTQTVQTDRWLDLGQRRLHLRAFSSAHTSHDLMVWDENTDTLLTGDLLFVGHVPVVDGSVRGWLSQLEDLSRHRFAQVVPGHGPLVRNWPQGAQAQMTYLRRLQEGTRSAIRSGHSLQQAMATVAPHNTENWLLFELFHRRNVAAVFAELEWE